MTGLSPAGWATPGSMLNTQEGVDNAYSLRGWNSRRLAKPPKKGQAAKDYNESRELTKAINAENEERAAGVAASSGGQLNVVKPPPVLATADHKQRQQKGSEK
ncbi:hypothetical protein N2152v2_008383 [Parachlorella kessleri]